MNSKVITMGVDLGGTNLRVAAMDERGALVAVDRAPLEDSSPEAVLRSMRSRVERTAGEAGCSLRSVGALCIALAGQVHRATGVVALGPNLGWRNIPFGEMLSGVFPFPVRLENDLWAAAWGERTAGAGEGSDNLALVAVGSGVGAGLIEAGGLMDGAGGLAGEIGHIKVVPDGEPCGCGERGCLEAYTGGHRMTGRALRFWKEAGVERPLGMEPGSITMKDVYRAFEEEDPVARRVLAEAGAHLGLSIANLVTLLNPGRVILAGGVLLGAPYLVERVLESVAAYTSAPARGEVSVRMAALGDDAGLVGAGHLARDLL